MSSPKPIGAQSASLGNIGMKLFAENYFRRVVGLLLAFVVFFALTSIVSCNADEEEVDLSGHIDDSKWLAGGEFVILIDSYYEFEDRSYFLTVSYHDRWPSIQLVDEMFKRPNRLFFVDDKLMTLNNDGYMGVVEKQYTFVWSNFNASPYNMNSITSGEGQLVAVGDDGRIIFRPVGRSAWQLKRVGRLVDLNTIVYGNGVFVASGGQGYVYTSKDKGASWTELSNVFVSDEDDAETNADENLTNMNAGLYAAGTFVLVGDNAKILVSEDAENWVLVPLPTALSNVDLLDITYGDGLFVAVGGKRPNPNIDDDSGIIAATITDENLSIRLTSLSGAVETEVPPSLILVSDDNGRTWIEKPSPSEFQHGWFLSVDYREGNKQLAGSGRYTLRRPLFLAVGTGSIIAYSTNGDKWFAMGLGELLENIPSGDISGGDTLISRPFFNGISNQYRPSDTAITTKVISAGSDGSVARFGLNDPHVFRSVRVYK